MGQQELTKAYLQTPEQLLRVKTGARLRHKLLRVHESGIFCSVCVQNLCKWYNVYLRNSGI